MTICQPFLDGFGPAAPGTGLRPVELGLAESRPLSELHRQAGGGVFANGLVSILSVREHVADLGGWERFLPNNVRLFGSSAFGLLFLTSGEDLWLVDTQMQDLFEAAMPLTEFFNALALPENRSEHLREGLFLEWRRGVLDLAVDCVLCPTPAISLGGAWIADSLRPVRLSEFLILTSQLM